MKWKVEVEIYRQSSEMKGEREAPFFFRIFLLSGLGKREQWILHEKAVRAGPGSHTAPSRVEGRAGRHILRPPLWAREWWG